MARPVDVADVADFLTRRPEVMKGGKSSGTKVATARSGMKWGYYCRTCGQSTPTWFQDVDTAFAAVRRRDEPCLAPLALRFLSLHAGHEIWAECELGVLRVSAGGIPARGRTRLPAFARAIS